MTRQRTKLLEKSARIAFSNAVAARKKLAAAMEAEGDVHIPMFLTSEEHRKIVRAMRADHERQLTGLFVHLTSPESKYVRIAQLALHASGEAAHRSRRDAFPVIESGDASQREVTAGEILRAGRKRRGEQ